MDGWVSQQIRTRLNRTGRGNELCRLNFFLILYIYPQALIQIFRFFFWVEISSVSAYSRYLRGLNMNLHLYHQVSKAWHVCGRGIQPFVLYVHPTQGLVFYKSDFVSGLKCFLISNS